MTFKDEEWNTRLHTMGDIAEREFELWATSTGLNWSRYGLNRPPLHFPSLPAFIRYTPDYLCSKFLVEVQGFGKDQMLKVKFDKLDALEEWNQIHPVKMFTYDSTNKRAWMLDFNYLWNNADTSGTFPEGHRYYGYFADQMDDYAL